MSRRAFAPALELRRGRRQPEPSRLGEDPL